MSYNFKSIDYRDILNIFLMKNLDKYSWFECTSPIIAMFIGSAFGFVIYLFLPDNSGFALEMGARFYALIFSVLGWLLSLVVVQRKCIFCGGVTEIYDNMRTKYFLLLLCSVFCIGVLPVLLLENQLLYFYGIALFLTAVILGEVGRNDPWYLILGNRE